MRIMNEVFNLKRFGNYAAKRYSDNRKRYLLSAAAMLGTLLAVVTIMKISDPHGEHPVRDITGFFAFLPVISSVLLLADMNYLRNRHTSSVENTVPASVTEKFLFVLLNSTVVLFALYFAAYILIALLAVFVYGIGTAEVFFDFPQRSWNVVRIGFLFVNPLALYAGSMQRKSHLWSFILVMMTFVCAMLLCIVAPVGFSESLCQGYSFTPFFTTVMGTAESGMTTVSYNTAFLEGIMSDPAALYRLYGIVSAAVALVFWTAAWFNFRERSIK